MERFARERSTRQREIANARAAAGSLRGGNYLTDVVDGAAELWREAAAGIIADHLAIANDIGAGVEEIEGLRERVSRLFSDAQHDTVSWISELIAGQSAFWKPLVDRFCNVLSETRREAEIAFGREKLRRRAVASKSQSSALPQPTRRDFFLSHAFEDKDSIARPLGDELKQRGHSVWFDEYELTVGDGLRQKIDRGLVESRFGIVVLSPSFFAKRWTRYELDGLVAKAIVEDRKVILPVWHHIGRDEIAGHSPTLADMIGVDSARGIDEVAAELVRALRAAL
ncbi:MAG TPA: toll/interleukin-1 receptor domain-containing protein [Vicinamibacterales bacterium]|nr:toll/interleukin-1 receptor domain-containing protein [Vicinamibacterales bacterium]